MEKGEKVKKKKKVLKCCNMIVLARGEVFGNSILDRRRQALKVKIYY